MLIAKALGVMPDRFTARHDFAASLDRVDLACGVIEPGTVGCRFSNGSWPHDQMNRALKMRAEPVDAPS